MYSLYTFFRSTASWRVRIALHLKGISPNQISVNLSKKEQKSLDYVKVNPNKVN